MGFKVADPFELQSLHQRRAFRVVSVFGDTDLEQPSFRSNRCFVEIHVDISSGYAEISVKLPLHARYQPLETVNTLEWSLERQSCSFSLGMYQTRDKNRVDVWFCPLPDRKPKPDPLSEKSLLESGIMQSMYLLLNFFAAVLSAFSIVVASALTSKVKPCKNTKQS